MRIVPKRFLLTIIAIRLCSVYIYDIIKGDQVNES